MFLIWDEVREKQVNDNLLERYSPRRKQLDAELLSTAFNRVKKKEMASRARRTEDRMSEDKCTKCMQPVSCCSTCDNMPFFMKPQAE